MLHRFAILDDDDDDDDDDAIPLVFTSSCAVTSQVRLGNIFSNSQEVEGEGDHAAEAATMEEGVGSPAKQVLLAASKFKAFSCLGL